MSTFERHTLPNGLRVLTAPMPQAQSVTCFVMLAAGARYETKETNGIAHFAEHMFFKGTERRPTARDLAAEVDSIGGEFNAFTSKEYTGYYVKCAAEFRDTALGWDIIGRKETVRAARRETFFDYIDRWYKPSRMVVGVGGKIGVGLPEHLQELLGDLEDAETGTPLPAETSP